MKDSWTNRKGGPDQISSQVTSAHRWLAAWFLLPFLVWGVLLADNVLRASKQADSSAQWMRRLNLSAPAFRPSGTLGRHPEFRSPAVDTRFSPLLPVGGPGRLMEKADTHEN